MWMQKNDYFGSNREIEKAIDYTDYQWIMFYPSVYFFSISDAYKDAGGGKEPYSFIPFALSAKTMDSN